MATTKTTLAAHLVELARAFEPLNGSGRSAAVWSLEGEPRLLYAGPDAMEDVVAAATQRLGGGESTFEVFGGPGVLGKVVVCGEGSDRAAYGLFIHGAGQPHLAKTIEQLIETAEKSLGKSVESMTRDEKQRVVRFLDERGAFLIRKAVEQAADRLGVTRFTIYNYLGHRAD